VREQRQKHVFIQTRLTRTEAANWRAAARQQDTSVARLIRVSVREKLASTPPTTTGSTG